MDTAGMPKTRKEAQDTMVKYYFTGEPCKHGHIAPRKTKGACIECIKVEWEEAATKRAVYFAEYNKSKIGQESKRRYYEANKDLVKLKASSRPEFQKQKYRKEWLSRNPDWRRADNKHRRVKHRAATPNWLTTSDKQKIRQFYLDALAATRVTGVKYVVDHIVPLRGESVCGLHVPWNLRVVTREENLMKSNKHLDATTSGV